MLISCVRIIKIDNTRQSMLNEKAMAQLGTYRGSAVVRRGGRVHRQYVNWSLRLELPQFFRLYQCTETRVEFGTMITALEGVRQARCTIEPSHITNEVSERLRTSGGGAVERTRPARTRGKRVRSVTRSRTSELSALHGN
jgi:hypothetical protein